jgi:hypothetical protein
LYGTEKRVPPGMLREVNEQRLDPLNRGLDLDPSFDFVHSMPTVGPVQRRRGCDRFTTLPGIRPGRSALQRRS